MAGDDNTPDVTDAALGSLLQRVLELQPQWQWRVNDVMLERQQLIRSACPAVLRAALPYVAPREGFRAAGSDGAGRKARIPWVRVYVPIRSPKATKGWYVVYLFAGDGSSLYLSLNQGTTDPETGFKTRDRQYLADRVAWATGLLANEGVDVSGLLPTIDLHSTGTLARAYEAGNVYSVEYRRDALPPDKTLLADLRRMLGLLDMVYAAERGASTGLLDGFTDPVPFTSEHIRAAPPVPGVHVVWGTDGEPLYVGESGDLRRRLREHLSGDRQASILHNKVGRMLDKELGRTATRDEIRSFLRSCEVAWRATDDPASLKQRIMDELDPPLNERRPSGAKRADHTDDDGEEPLVLAVYVGVGQNAQTNLRRGIGTGLWGFTVHRDDYERIRLGDWILLGSGFSAGSPRAKLDVWLQHRLGTAVLGRVTRTAYVDWEPHWDDEKRGEVSYPYRIGFDVVAMLTDLDLSDADLIDPGVVSALQRSVSRGAGYVAVARGRLFDQPEDVEDMVDDFEPLKDLAQICRAFADALDEANLHFGQRHLEFVRNFVVSLATRRMVLLAGQTGSGKSRIGIGFGQWLGKERYLVVPVRPDWTGPEPLLGYEDALLEAKPGRRAWNAPTALRFMLRAAADPGNPYVLVLDEMNLAHVERYFADLLSGIESGQDVLPNLVCEADGCWRVPAGGPDRLPAPRNLFIIGTVNVDETTQVFSPKVLDRANAIEFRVASDDLNVDALRPTDVLPATPELAKGFLAIATDHQFETINPAANRTEFADHLVALHRLLSEHDFEYGHRLFADALRFAALLDAAGETGRWRALDLQVKQRILPRLHGSARQLTEPLAALARYCLDLSVTNPLYDLSGSHNADLPESFDKINRLSRRLRATQYASFWE
jgi:hypothetical protein